MDFCLCWKLSLDGFSDFDEVAKVSCVVEFIGEHKRADFVFEGALEFGVGDNGSGSHIV